MIFQLQYEISQKDHDYFRQVLMVYLVSEIFASLRPLNIPMGFV